MRAGLGLMLAAAALIATPFVWAAAPTPRFDVFTVVAVPVDATADNAATARDEARLAGEQHAYEILLNRLTRASDRSRLPQPTETLLDTLISSFEVEHERRSGVRYLADYTYHFSAAAVRRMLNQAGVPFAETPSKPLVVLALLDSSAGAALWEDPNPWREAWAASKPATGLVPLIVPYGDLQDVAAIDAAAAESGDTGRLQAFAQRYGDVGVLVTRATLKTGAEAHDLAVSSTRYEPGVAGNPPSFTADYTAKPGESDADLMAAAVAGTEAQVEEAWKAANILDFGHTAALEATVPVSGLADWVDLRSRLAGVPAIQAIELLSLDRQAAHISILYIGNPEQLRLALAQRDLDLGGSDPNWILERRQPGSASP